ncbi:MAG: hypothetical protein ACREBY_07335 [Polaromonas sp.]
MNDIFPDQAAQRQSCRGLRGQGATVVCSARNEQELRDTLALIEKAGGRPSMFVADAVKHAQMVA